MDRKVCRNVLGKFSGLILLLVASSSSYLPIFSNNIGISYLWKMKQFFILKKGAFSKEIGGCEIQTQALLYTLPHGPNNWGSK